jgi:hypothetical protein
MRMLRVAAASTCPACNRSYRLRSPRTGAHLPSSSHHRCIPAQLQPINRRSSALCDAAPQADHRVACRAINRCHRPLLRPVTDGSPPPELPRAPPHTPLPPVLLQPSHHSVRSPPTHRPSTAHQQPPSTYGPRCRRQARPLDRRRREQPDSGEDSPLLTPKSGTPLCQFAPGQFPRLPAPPVHRNRPGAAARCRRPRLPCFWQWAASPGRASPYAGQR